MERKSLSYRLGKFVRSHDWRVTIVVAVLAYIWGFNAGAEYELQESAEMLHRPADDQWRLLHEDAVRSRYPRRESE